MSLQSSSNDGFTSLMRHFYIFILVSFLCANSQAGITLTSPTGGETWTAGEQVTVTWTYSNILDNASVTLLIRRGLDGGGALIRRTISDSIIFLPLGSATFNIPTWLGDGENYYIEIQAHDIFNNSVSYRTTTPLTIVGSEIIRRLDLLQPKLLQQWEAGSTQRITWSTNNLAGTNLVLFTFKQHGISKATIFNEGLAMDGAINIVVPENIGNGTNYRLFVRLGSVFDESAPIEIMNSLPRPTITLTSPNGGEKFSTDSPIEVCWNRDKTDDNLYFALRKDDLPDNFNFYQSKISDECITMNPFHTINGHNYRVHITRYTADGNIVKDASDNTFSITTDEKVPTIALTSHNDGSSVPLGSLQTITWEGSGLHLGASTIIKLIAKDDFRWTKYLNIGQIDNESFMNWTACPTLMEDMKYWIEVCGYSLSFDRICDVNDLPFEIVFPPDVPKLRLLSPHHEDLLITGTTITIKWDAQNAMDKNVEVFFSYVNDHFLSSIATVPASDGQVDWVVHRASPGFRSFSIVIRIKENNCNIAFDRADFLTVQSIYCTCGDINYDFAMNLVDHALIANCIGLLSSITPECICSDLNWDGRINLYDYAVFQNLYDTGSAEYPPNCP